MPSFGKWAGVHQGRYVGHLLLRRHYPHESYLRAKDRVRALRNVRRDPEELGREFICWTVLGALLPEAAGIRGRSRVGTGRIGPSTLMQYNSWNNVVWRNDPEPRAISQARARHHPPGPGQYGRRANAPDGQTPNSIRTACGSKAPAAPHRFVSLPASLYDFDPTKTNNLVPDCETQRGTYSGPLDADQRGVECPWWLRKSTGPSVHGRCSHI